MVSFCFKRNSKLKKGFILRIHGACSNTNLTSGSLYYEPWRIRNPGIFIIRGIFTTLEYSKVRRYLHSCQIFCDVFRKQFQAIISFLLNAPSQTILDVRQGSKYAYVSISATQPAQLFQVLLQVCSDIFKHYSRAYSRIFRTFCILGIFKILVYSCHKAYSDSTVHSKYHIKHFHKSSILLNQF